MRSRTKGELRNSRSKMRALDILGVIELARGPGDEGVDVRVRLEDTTMMDGPSIVIAETLLRLVPGAPMPAPFRLAVPVERIDPRRQYTLSARGRRVGSTHFRDFGTVESYPWRVGVNSSYRLTMTTFTSD